MRHFATLLLLIGCLQFTISAQVEVDTSFSAEYYVNDILLTVANSVPAQIGQTFTVQDINDMAMLEFDFTATADSMSFQYVFRRKEVQVKGDENLLLALVVRTSHPN